MKKSFKFGVASLAKLSLLTPIQEEVIAASSQSAKFKISTIKSRAPLPINTDLLATFNKALIFILYTSLA